MGRVRLCCAGRGGASGAPRHEDSGTGAAAPGTAAPALGLGPLVFTGFTQLLWQTASALFTAAVRFVRLCLVCTAAYAATVIFKLKVKKDWLEACVPFGPFTAFMVVPSSGQV